ncbi:hypothetical protein BCR34DRAFT_512113 [Clohesyomyces aquaticus]|uniref:Prion-inhibition and propagation-domain-containing protein n=1 Tax=Clohesyomyces aquaticus TaxID=1231657 RepID=A0A1Y1ZR92_9PLEO|nr:hypothetical protein BCR34DRAFT_512113 [Clohesyomyces aquaticus]
MAEIIGILGGIATSAHLLNNFANQAHKWRLLSDRLFDIKECLDAAELTLESWRRKYDIQDRRPIIYMHVLFGRTGTERIQQTLGSIKIVLRTIERDIDRVVGTALKVRPRGAASDTKDEVLVQQCLRRIRANTTWSRKFQYSVLDKAGDIEMRIERLFRKLNMLERFSDQFLEKEHPDIFQTIKRLPGRRVILKVGDSSHEIVQNKLLDAISARKDAELLHRASGGQSNRVHIGLSVPQIIKRDFAFLLSLNGRTHEVHVHPITIKAYSDRSRLPSTISHAVPALIQNALEPCYMLPPDTRSAGFEVKLISNNILTDLEQKDPLSTLLTHQNDFLGQQVLYPQDQVALACGIAQGSFRLIGSQWLQFLDCKNLRWRRSAAGQWTSMMAAEPGDGAITRTLEQVVSENRSRRDKRDLSRHCHIFRIGLILTELALKIPVTYIDFDTLTGGVKVYITNLSHDAMDATNIAAEVDMKTNVFYGNIVWFCLSVLMEGDMMGDREIESGYYKDVLGPAEELEAMVLADRKRGSPIGTPSSRGGNSPLR